MLLSADDCVARWNRPSQAAIGAVLCLALLAVGALGCSDESDRGAGGSGADAGAPPAGGGGGQSCAPGEEPLADGGCRAAGAEAGVPSERCAEGFVPSGDGCEPVLPAEACPAGQIALPGEASCREVGSCGDAPWGDLPVDAATHYVDGSYTGGASDGSVDTPWPTISEAIAAAPAGGLVAVAAGHYVEDIRVEQRAVRIWGRCPRLVRVTGAGVQPATINIIGVADAELRGLTVDGPRAGIWLSATPDALIHTLVIADTGGVGLSVKESAASLVAHELLIDGALGAGALIQAATVELEAAVLRATAPNSMGQQGFGVVAQPDPLTGQRSTVTVRRSVLEGLRGIGINILGSDAEIHGSVIRDVALEDATRTGGHGAQVWIEPERAGRGTLLLDSSLVERCSGHAVLVGGSDCDVAASVLRDTGWQAGSNGRHWAAAWLEDEPTAELSRGTIRQSLVERGHDAGIQIRGASVEVDRVVVRDTQYGEHGWGRGISATGSWHTPAATQVRVLGSRVEANRSVGILAAGVEAEIVGTLISGTLTHADNAFGYGLNFQDHAVTLERTTGTIRYSVVEDSISCGLLVSSADAVIESTAVRNTDVSELGDVGFGIGVQMSQWTVPGSAVPATALIRSCAIEQNREAGVANFGSQVELDRTAIVQTQGNRFGLLGDGVALAPQFALPAGVRITASQVLHSSRAGVASFGGAVELEGTQLDCNAFALAGESTGELGPAFEDRGGNWCGCDGVSAPCRVMTAQLQPPQPLGSN